MSLYLVGQKRCVVREQYKLDYDYYSRGVRALKEKPGANVAKLEKKETKLRNAESLLTAYSTELFQHIRTLQQQRDTSLLPQLCQVCLSPTLTLMAATPRFGMLLLACCCCCCCCGCVEVSSAGAKLLC
jgi:hypothetical protein